MTTENLARTVPIFPDFEVYHPAHNVTSLGPWRDVDFCWITTGHRLSACLSPWGEFIGGHIVAKERE